MLIPRMMSPTRDLTRAIDQVKKAVDPFLGQPYLGGVLVEAVSVVAAVPFAVNHNLGRAATGAVVTSATASAMMTVRPYTSFTPTPDPNNQIALQSSATGTLSLWVF